MKVNYLQQITYRHLPSDFRDRHAESVVTNPYWELVDPDRLLLTNGGAEAIALVGAELGGRVEEPDFALYPRGGGPLWRSNPHNPTGRLARGPADVWDEAFYPLATGR